MSLRARLLVALLFAVVAGLAIVDVLTYVLVDRAQLDLIDDDLERAHPPIERAAVSGASDLEDAIRRAAPGFYVELRDATGSNLVTVPLLRPGEQPERLAADTEIPAPASELGDDEAVFATVPIQGEHDLRVRISRQPDDAILVIGRSLEPVDDARDRLVVILGVASLGAVAVVVLLGKRLVGAGLRPLTAVEDAAARITDDELDRRVPVADPGTEVGALATTINSMLERLESAFEQRAADLAALQASESRMRRFVADASHELRTPIAATAAYAELFERGARDRPEDLSRAMAGIRSETARMGALVDDLLLLAQLDEGRELEHHDVDLADLVLDAVDAALAVAPERPVEVGLEDAAVVRGDAGRLRQVVDNLLANVRTHTPPGTTCRVTVRATGTDAVVEIADDGPGMSPGDAALAFDRFHRADPSRTRASGGAGLGLAIVEAIVAAHGGTASIDTEPGRGTIVTVRLPAVRHPAGDDREETA